jgi:hypothetical protein
MTRISAGDNQKFNDEVIKTLKRIRTKIKVRLENGQPVAANYRLPLGLMTIKISTTSLLIYFS